MKLIRTLNYKHQYVYSATFYSFTTCFVLSQKLSAVVTFTEVSSRENMHTCRSSSGIVPGNDSWKPKAPKVQAKFVIVILPQELGMNFRYTVNSLWSLNRDVWGRVTRRLRAEGSNCARNEQFQLVLLG